MTRRRLLGLGITGAIMGAPVVQGLIAEPRLPALTTLSVDHALPGGPLVVAHLTDLHFRGDARLVSQALHMVQWASPHLVVLTGDYVDKRPEALTRLVSLLGALRPPLGVVAVPGNWERWSGVGITAWRDSFEAAGIKTLVNEWHRMDDGTRSITVVGIDDLLTGGADWERAFSGAPDADLRLVLSHSPAALDPAVAAGVTFDLALSGHTHGGQIRLPFLGALWLPPASGSYQMGMYHTPGGPLYVSRGVGTSAFPIRLFCRPEVVIATIG